MAYIDGNGSKGHHTFRLTISQDSTNISNNNSTVSFAFSIKPIQNSWNWELWGSNISYSININGTNYTGTIPNYDGYSTVTLKSGSQSIPHNQDGTKTISYSFSVSDTTGQYYTCGNASASGTMVLTTIPRQATISSAPNFNDEENPTITYSNPASNSVSSLQACISLDGTLDDIKYRDIPIDGSSYTFELTEDERNILRNACTTDNNRNVIFYIKTVINGVIYYSMLSKKLTIINANPSVSLIAIDSNPTTKTLTADDNKFIKYFSTASLTLSATTKKYATISSTKITCEDGKVSNSTSATFNNVESGNFTGGVIDSRGNPASITLNKTLIDYIKLTCNVDIYRPEPTTGEVNLKVSGNYFNGSFGSVENTITLQYRYKESMTSYWSDWISITAIKNGNGYYWDGSLGTNFDYTKAYNFQINAYDKLMNLSVDRSVFQGIPVFDWGENDFKFNVPVFDAFDTRYNNGLATYYDGEIDPNETLESLILTKHGNSPGLGDFWYIETKFYSTKSTISNRTQVAYPYQYLHNGVFVRASNGSAWSEWIPVGAKEEKSYAQMHTNGVITFETAVMVTNWSTNNINLGKFECQPTNNRIYIPKGSATIVRVFGSVAGNGYTSSSIILEDEDGILVGRDFFNYQAQGNKYFKLNAWENTFQIDSTKDHYLYLNVGNYNNVNFRMNDGFGANATFIGVEKIN